MLTNVLPMFELASIDAFNLLQSSKNKMNKELKTHQMFCLYSLKPEMIEETFIRSNSRFLMNQIKHFQHKENITLNCSE